MILLVRHGTSYRYWSHNFKWLELHSKYDPSYLTISEAEWIVSYQRLKRGSYNLLSENEFIIFQLMNE